MNTVRAITSKFLPIVLDSVRKHPFLGSCRILFLTVPVMSEPRDKINELRTNLRRPPKILKLLFSKTLGTNSFLQSQKQWLIFTKQVLLKLQSVIIITVIIMNVIIIKVEITLFLYCGKI